MKFKNRAIASALVAGALTVCGFIGAAPANAAVASGSNSGYVEGGIWNYGVSSGVFSNYNQPTKLHRATSCNGNNNCQRSADVWGGSWANSGIAKTSGGNTAFYYNY